MKTKINLFVKACKPVLLLSILLSFLFAASAFAVIQPIGGKITRTLASDEGYGGCMVMLDSNIQDILPNCNANWVSLDCDAEYNSPEQSSAYWDSALMAFALDKQVIIWVSDAEIVPNGFCTVHRIDIVK